MFVLNQLAIRKGSEGYSIATQTWYLLIKGAATKDVPNYYPVSTDPSLIFLVLRDPPGGASSVTMSQGTSITFSMGVGGMHAYEDVFEKRIDGDLGVEVTLEKCVGLGAEVCDSILDSTNIVNAHASSEHTISTERSSAASYDYTFTFGYDISTSSDPNTAGHARLVILQQMPSILCMNPFDVNH